jgi:hypothetical protein
VALGIRKTEALRHNKWIVQKYPLKWIWYFQNIWWNAWQFPGCSWYRLEKALYSFSYSLAHIIICLHALLALPALHRVSVGSCDEKGEVLLLQVPVFFRVDKRVRKFRKSHELRQEVSVGSHGYSCGRLTLQICMLSNLSRQESTYSWKRNFGELSFCAFYSTQPNLVGNSIAFSVHLNNGVSKTSWQRSVRALFLELYP